ncbi:hypothetical protein RHSP_04994 [Rhizobium freirei PRF 81]|uniref:Uncharacterized protein n=1 Tax=Rhizobium freirei PRF 81 TaxID=363754 RepID=N6V3S6_9HYPH|nr:hypothetical protein [Rhizobium freirei]ENN88515.1 hypothetical protein RHSP_04994 [Rhizobium freirei PRF 81]
MTKEMSIKGVVYHVQAIIDQGRVDEFLAACDRNGFTTMSGPDGLIAFTRNFLSAASSTSAMPKFSETLDAKVKTVIGQSLQINQSKIDVCDC